jgi:hypothetical protein
MTLNGTLNSKINILEVFQREKGMSLNADRRQRALIIRE